MEQITLLLVTFSTALFLRSKNRGDSPYSFLTEDSALSLALSIFPESYEFDGEEVLKLVEPGLYKRGWRVQQKKSDKAE